MNNNNNNNKSREEFEPQPLSGAEDAIDPDIIQEAIRLEEEEETALSMQNVEEDALLEEFGF